jgi:hypothetical protein
MRSFPILLAFALACCCTRVLDLGDDRGAVATFAGQPCSDDLGLCPPGDFCKRSCELCVCDTAAKWMCSATCGTGCPTELPTAGTACNATRCEYATDCGAVDVAACIGDRWEIFAGTCKDPNAECPPVDQPPTGSCSSGLVCRFQTKCATSYLAKCDETGTWQTEVVPPCDPGGCPAAPPPNGDRCGQDTQCEWKNDCGTMDYAVCSGGSWSTKRTCLPAGCPFEEPLASSPCKDDGLSCSYTRGCTRGETVARCERGAWRIDRC